MLVQSLMQSLEDYAESEIVKCSVCKIVQCFSAESEVCIYMSGSTWTVKFHSRDEILYASPWDLHEGLLELSLEGVGVPESALEVVERLCSAEASAEQDSSVDIPVEVW